MVFKESRPALVIVERPPLFLDQISECLLEGDRGAYAGSQHGVQITTDHLVPQLAARQNKRLFSEIVERHENKVCLCRNCHNKRDGDKQFGKLQIYRQFGVAGLVQDLAAYPRANNPDLYVIQYHQFRELFNLISDKIDYLTREGKIPQLKQRDYSSARDAIAYHRYQWEAGNFDVRYSALDLLLQH